MTWMVGVVGAFVASLSPAVATQGAARVAETVAVGPPPTTIQVSGPCAQWHDTAIAVGWDDADWPHLARIMWCESRCNPDAHNPSGASGLAQVLRSWFGPGEDPFDPATNLAVALRVRQEQGWRAWSCN
jgi:hypothetical protein